VNLRNYTSETTVEKSVADIMRLLVSAGATQIGMDYKDQMLSGVVFKMAVGPLPVLFRLPARPEAVAKVMKDEVKKPRAGTFKRIDEQAERTAWALLRDWVHVQVSMIAMEQAEAIQVFLPYAWDPAKEQTFFDRMKGNGFKQLSAGKNEQ
jgi:hypothetical protein